MKQSQLIRFRLHSVVGIGFFFAYLMYFFFNGSVLDKLLESYSKSAWIYLLCAMGAHFTGLIVSNYYIKNIKNAKQVMVLSMLICLVANGIFFFYPVFHWGIVFVVSFFAIGGAITSWGYILRVHEKRKQRLKSCAYVLILANLLTIVIEWISKIIPSPFKYILGIACILIGVVFVSLLETEPSKNVFKSEIKCPELYRKSLMLLILFTFTISGISGLMFQVINSSHLNIKNTVSWHGALSYALIILLLYILPPKVRRYHFLHLGFIMIIAAFISFLFREMGKAEFLVLGMLISAALGIFDLFLWSVLGDMLDYADKSSLALGIIITMKVLGGLFGELLGITVSSVGLDKAYITVIALCGVCISLFLLPQLNSVLILLLKDHPYLAYYNNDSGSNVVSLDLNAAIVDNLLTERECEVFHLLLQGKSNREIAETMFISENTVKTHVKNIFRKYKVSSRMELVNAVLNKTS